MTKTLLEFEDDDKVGNIPFHKFNEAAEVKGILKEVVDGAYGKQFIIELEDGKKVIVGSYVAISDKLNEDDVNKAVKIVYKGPKSGKKSKKPYMSFDVFKKDLKEEDN